MKCRFLGADDLCLKQPFGNGGFEYCVQGPCDEIFNPTPPRKIKRHFCVQANVYGYDVFCIRNFDNGAGCKTCPDLRSFLADIEKLGIEV